MLNNYLIPFLVMIIICYGFFKGTNIYEEFLSGAIDGLKIVYEIIPTVLAMIFAVNIFVSSGILDILKGFTTEILPMAFLRPISGNASLAFLSTIYESYGVDSFLGFLGSIIQGATDTTIYILGMYFSSVGIKKIRYSLIVGLLADLICVIVAIIVVNVIF